MGRKGGDMGGETRIGSDDMRRRSDVDRQWKEKGVELQCRSSSALCLQTSEGFGEAGSAD